MAATKRHPHGTRFHKWIVFVSAVIVYCNIIGFYFALGALFPTIIETFDVTRAKASLIQSVYAASIYGGGVLYGIMTDKFGPRWMGMLGASLTSTGLFISFWAKSLVFLVVSLGFIKGCGAGLCMVSTSLTVRQHFTGKLCVITLSILVSGSGVGGMAIIYLIRYLSDTFGLNGTLLILAGIDMNCTVLGLLWTPPNEQTSIEDVSEHVPREKSEPIDTVNDKSVDLQNDQMREKNSGCLCIEGNDGNSNQGFDSGSDKISEEKETVFVKSVDKETYAKTETVNKIPTRVAHEQNRNDSLNGTDKSLEAVKNIDIKETPMSDNGTTINNSLTLTATHGILSDVNGSTATNTLQRQTNVSVVTTDRRVSVSYSQYVQGGDMAPHKEEITMPGNLSLKQKLKNMFRVKSFLFTFIGLSLSLNCSLMFIVFLVDIIMDSGYTESQGALGLTILTIANILGRLSHGTLIPCSFDTTFVIPIIATALSSLAMLVMALVDNIIVYYILCVVLGNGVGVQVSIIVVTSAEILDEIYLPYAIGTLITVTGLPNLAVGPIAGAIRDATGTYTVSILVAAAINSIGLIMFIFANRYHTTKNFI